jgi:tRNA-uridine 2-sulfurtransferase
MKRVVVGLSGGVDSSVAAYLLKEQGYDVVGLFMRNWNDSSVTLSGDCSWEEDSIMAELVASRLQIPFHFVDLSEPYRKRVVDYMFAEYERGRTPNPDVLCNREIKFDVFLDECLKLGADYVATGHYCRKEEILVDGEPMYRLLAGSDPNKDQSYFLCQLSQKQLEKALFPIGHLLKPEVREVAAKLNLATAHRKDSQGICFVGKVDLPVFLQQKLKATKGKIIEVKSDLSQYADYQTLVNQPEFREEQFPDLARPFVYTEKDGRVVGEHSGAHFYTIGQRKGLNVGGMKEPLFVVAIDVQNNIVYTGQGEKHPGLYRKALFINSSEMHWIRPDLKLDVGQQREYLFRIRYRQPLQKGKISCTENGFYILFNELQRGITAGQFASWYDGDELIGSGVISE